MTRVLLATFLLAGCSGDHSIDGDYDLDEVLDNTCAVQPEVGDVMEIVRSCGAERLEDTSVACNDDTVDFFLRVDSFAENRGRKTYCSLPDNSGAFACQVVDSGHAWEGRVDADTSDVTLNYAHGTPVEENDYSGLAGVTDVDCSMDLHYFWHNKLKTGGYPPVGI